MEENTSSRLKKLINELTQGDAKKFGEQAGIDQATFWRFQKKQPNAVKNLENICKKYGVNLNWLVAGKGPQMIEKEDIFDEMRKWAEAEQVTTAEIERRLPDFKEWIRKK